MLLESYQTQKLCTLIQHRETSIYYFFTYIQGFYKSSISSFCSDSLGVWHLLLWIYFSMHKMKGAQVTLRFSIKEVKNHESQTRIRVPLRRPWRFKEREDRNPELWLSKWIHNNSVHFDSPVAMTQSSIYPLLQIYACAFISVWNCILYSACLTHLLILLIFILH